ncbi:MAG: antitoxin VapB family protein [Nanoarchaeota archaeon]
MASVNISIKDDAYRFLKSLKGNNESFSEVILRFKEKKGSKEAIMKYFGVLKDADIDWSETEKRMKRLRESINKRMKENRKNMQHD